MKKPRRGGVGWGLAFGNFDRFAGVGQHAAGDVRDAMFGVGQDRLTCEALVASEVVPADLDVG